ncbi:hypothetical protein [Kocuria atrinae]|uniref:hypothetical protein n=1 Tax=Kocuria atrinae TaxID=592377 RepID=UPI001CB95A4F|nr:hypothetical protein [Kocuria atrinae]
MPDLPDSLEELRPTPGPIIAAREEHAQGIVDLRNRIARWLQGRGIDQWREGEFDPKDVAQEIRRGEWSVIESPEDPTEVLASVQVLWEDLRIWGKQDEPRATCTGWRWTVRCVAPEPARR